MQFINFLMLFGLAAIAIPIIIQILTRKNVRRINWGAWLFLDKTMKARSEQAARAGRRRGTLFASGLIVGESIIGVIMAGIIVVSLSGGGSDDPLGLVGKDFADTAEWLGLIVFVCVLAIFSKVVKGSKAKA